MVNRFQIDRDAFMCGIMGPVGSGKSVGCTLRVFEHICSMPRSRWAVIRNTYRELQDTTLATWMEWLRPYGEFKHGTMTHHINVEGCTADVLFRALDRPDDIGKLLSLELTGAWVNESREIPYAIIKNLRPRVLRYPRFAEAPADTWHGIIMDTNPPDDLHWWYQKFEEQRPDGWKLYRQPGGREPDAENLDNLPPGYYDTIASGEDQAWIDVYVNGQYGFVLEGKPVWPQFNDRIHIATAPIEPDPHAVLEVGLDFGLTPAAVFIQQAPSDGQYRVLGELVTQDTSAMEFGDILGQILRKQYRGYKVNITGDPAGVQRAQTDKRTPFDILRGQGIEAAPAHTNDFMVRVEAVALPLRRITPTGNPGMIVSPSCRYLRRALAGGYKYRQLQISGDERHALEPDKNLYSHVAEALQYGLMGAGADSAVIGSDWGELDTSMIDAAVI